MAMLATGIVGGEMAWPLVLVGMAFSVGLILIKSPSPMLIAVGMYLPLETTFAIFVGGGIRYVLDVLMDRKGVKGGLRARVANNGLLVASGLIAGEALTGVILAIMVLAREKIPGLVFPHLVEGGSGWAMLAIFAAVVFTLLYFPMKSLNQEKS